MSWWRPLFFVLAFAAFAAATAPAPALLPSRAGAFSYESAEGSIWRARFSGARVAGIDAGRMEWRLSLFDLLQGKMIAQVTFAEGSLRGAASLLANAEGDRRIIAPSLRLLGAPIAEGVALSGETAIQSLDLYFDNGRCRTAQGRVTSDILAENETDLGWRGPVLSGAAQCAGDAALLTMEGMSGGETFRSEIELQANGAGVWRARARSARPALVALLTTGGAHAGADGSAQIDRTFRWLPL